jgi:phosphatidylserine decarboxylase
MLVPVAAILVASIRFNFVDTMRFLHPKGARHEQNRRRHKAHKARALRTKRRGGGAKLGIVHPIPCFAELAKGEEMGWFEHGSTIIMFAPEGFELADGVGEGTRIKAGQALMRLPTEAERAIAAD